MTSFILAAAARGSRQLWFLNNFLFQNEKIEFTLRLYDGLEVEIDKAGTIYMKATCDLLPIEISVNVEKEYVHMKNETSLFIFSRFPWNKNADFIERLTPALQ